MNIHQKLWTIQILPRHQDQEMQWEALFSHRLSSTIPSHYPVTNIHSTSDKHDEEGIIGFQITLLATSDIAYEKLKNKQNVENSIFIFSFPTLYLSSQTWKFWMNKVIYLVLYKLKAHSHDVFFTICSYSLYPVCCCVLWAHKIYIPQHIWCQTALENQK